MDGQSTRRGPPLLTMGGPGVDTRAMNCVYILVRKVANRHHFAAVTTIILLFHLTHFLLKEITPYITPRRVMGQGVPRSGDVAPRALADIMSVPALLLHFNSAFRATMWTLKCLLFHRLLWLGLLE